MSLYARSENILTIIGGRLSYYHDKYGLEADAVLHLDDGRYALIECKLGSRDIDAGANNLLKLKELVTERNNRDKQVSMRLPDLLIILTGENCLHERRWRKSDSTGLFERLSKKRCYQISSGHPYNEPKNTQFYPAMSQKQPTLPCNETFCLYLH